MAVNKAVGAVGSHKTKVSESMWGRTVWTKTQDSKIYFPPFTARVTPAVSLAACIVGVEQGRQTHFG